MATTKPAISRIQGPGTATAAATLGTLIEWYDFFLFLNLATIIADRFFPASHPALALLFTLASFVAGIVMRPVGALFFGRRGDRSGRKPAWLMTLTIMGLSTFAIGLIPGYARIGVAAPVIILLLRLLQGLAVGGEYGGAAVYAVEHSPAHRRGFFTSWVQASAIAGLLISLALILLTRFALDPDRATSLEKFNAWGWRIPFLVSIILVVVASWFRMKWEESPAFTGLKSAGQLSPDPVKESFAKANGRNVLLSIFGLTMGQGPIFIATGMFAQSFMEKTCHIDIDQTRSMLLIALAVSLPFYILSGRWSDKLGRKWLMLAGMLLTVASWALLFHEMPAITGTSGRTLLTDKSEIRNTVSFIDRTKAMLRTSATINYYEDGMQVTESSTDTVYADGHSSLKPETSISSTLPGGDFWKIVAILFVAALGVAVSFGPAAAFLAELFPAAVRYTSLSFSYQAGIGIFGGLIPFIAVLLTRAYPAKDLAAFWYPIGLTIICLIIGALFLPARMKEPQLEIAP